MSCGYDHDYMLPHGALSRFLLEMTHMWPQWIAELQGGVILRRDEFQGDLPAAAESGLVLHRDTQMRDRFHIEGGFEDADGSSPISIWILGWDEAWTRVDFVIDPRPPSPFLERVLANIAQGIVDGAMRIERSATTTRYLNSMDPTWAHRNWPEIVKLEVQLQEQLNGIASRMQFLRLPEEESPNTCAIEVAGEHSSTRLVAATDRSVTRLLGCWHRVFYPENAGISAGYSMPPGDLRVRDDRGIEFLAGGRQLDWAPRHVPSLFKKPAAASKGRSR